MDEEEIKIVKSSLFHDLGKFYMRTHSESECKNLKTGEKLTHEDLLNRITNFVDIGEIDIKNEFVKMGDWLSSQEREETEQIEDLELREIRKIPLNNIFYLSDKNTKYQYIKPEKITLKKPSFSDFSGLEDDIFDKTLYEDFENELKTISKKIYEYDYRTQIRYILDLFKKYLYKIPSASYYTKPTIDLYNHSRISASIALSCYRYFKGKRNDFNELKNFMIDLFKMKKKLDNASNKEKNELERKIEKLKEKEIYNKKIFLLFEGDISGIQNFISTITTEHALKILRGRSFYIYIINKMAALKLLKELDLPETNLVYCSGGHFQIICDNSIKNLDIARNVFEEINKKLFENFRTKLFFSLSYIELSPRDLAFEKIENSFFKEKKYIFDKNKKFENIIKDIIKNQNFKIEVAGKNECKICKSEVFDENVCESCKDFEDLRSYLKEIQISKRMKNIKERRKYSKIFFFDDFDELFYNGQTRVNELEKYCIFEILPTGLPLDEENNVKELSELSFSNKIGALKFDVDDLGKILQKEPEDKQIKQTFSYYARLSFNINLFFEGIVNKIWEEKYKEKIIIVYSGGDDGFVIGDPFDVLNFAKDIYNYFKIYTGLSKKFKLSAAFRIFDSKYPVKKIFETLERDLKAAKDSREEKNSISINGDIIRWEYFENFENNIFSEEYENENLTEFNSDFELMIKLNRYILNLLKNKEISISLIYRIMEISKDLVNKFENNVGEKKILPNIYMLRYILFRNIKNEKLAEKIYSFLEYLIFSTNMTDEGMRELMYRFRSVKLAAQIAMFYYRIKMKNEVK
ncbi:MAG: type III-A CRISPR-associated protein Cas10/Csm1 [Candidatus Aenigmarchaeota archaeon]|nr:type III-A CRISPR-associated protein Cas10/Csm1 [Candidatus Aenigmarchaeota archaeon]